MATHPTCKMNQSKDMQVFPFQVVWDGVKVKVDFAISTVPGSALPLRGGGGKFR